MAYQYMKKAERDISDDEISEMLDQADKMEEGLDVVLDAAKSIRSILLRTDIADSRQVDDIYEVADEIYDNLKKCRSEKLFHLRKYLEKVSSK